MNGKCLGKFCVLAQNNSASQKAEENGSGAGSGSESESKSGWQEFRFIFMLLERKPEVAAVKYGEEYAGNAKFCNQKFRSNVRCRIS